MLVLSRGQNDKVVFPTLGITIEILRFEGKNVRLGIDAPRAIPVLRQEIADARPPVVAMHTGTATSASNNAPELSAQAGESAHHDDFTHKLRNRLHKATLGLHILQRMLENGNAEDAEATIFKIFSELKSIEHDLGNCPGDAPSSGRRALVVEDDDNERELLAGYLRLRGFDVETAVDGLQAMVQLSKHDRPDVVLLDMKMPRFDGGKTVSAIRQNPDHHNLKIFAVTGADPVEASVPLGPTGVNRWFSKPVDPEDLVQAMQYEFDHAVASA